MLQHPNLEFIPWDSVVFGMPCYELKNIADAELMRLLDNCPGHYTIRVNPTVSKESLFEHGFYYCDTLMEPYCVKENFIPPARRENIYVTKDISKELLLNICSVAFIHDRFHRDFNISADLADKRYDNWLVQLHERGKVYGLLCAGELVGFIAVERNKLVLHAICREHRGQGLGKYLWAPVCQALFKEGYAEVTSSVSASNSAIVNLYASLGFRFRNPVDIYHKLVK